MSPLQILATSLAYGVMADAAAATEEKAKIIGLLGKHLGKGELSEDNLKSLSTDAFEYVRRNDRADFLDQQAPALSHAQKLCILINLFDMVMADGSLKSGEIEVLAAFRKAFGIRKSDMQPVQKTLKLKNDTAVFLNANHPANSPRFRFDPCAD